ncbi:hypothetical protein [Pontimicrobium sp. SW4]|uniref:DUF4398 domain-containing protein n=1 Tax=Pontimicrobium sp. SW4 TaxID=3153519 RepID=A0AAU7BQH3_9FLAO
MKKNYLFFLFSLTFICTNAQNKCEDAHSDAIYAYSHVKSAYDSNNISHLKDYSKRSTEAFSRAKKILNDCGCETSYNYAFDAHELLSKVENAKTFEDGRFYVKRARDIAKKVINELEICTKPTQEDEALAALEYDRLKLKQQQIELNLKEAELKEKLAKKKAAELRLKKEQLISKNDLALTSNLESFNSILNVCDCDLEMPEINYKKEALLSKNLNEIKKEYLTIFKNMTSNYLDKLNACND